MSSYALTPLAKADVFGIWCRIAIDSPDIADRVEQAIYDACEFLAESPRRGHTRSDLTNRSVRFWTIVRYSNYTVVYRAETKPLQIVAVLHGKRDLRRVLRKRSV